MPPDIDFSRLTYAEKDVLILVLFAGIEALEKRIEELTQPPRTPDNSSTPPARGHKPNEGATALGGKPGLGPG